MFNLVKSKKMKLLYTVSFAALAAITFSSCTSIGKSSASETDDAYYSSADSKADWAAFRAKKEADRKQREADAIARDEARKREEAVAAAEARTKKEPDYYDKDFNYDDYYDYEYTTRIRRFYNPVYSYGYYDNYYTNSYWYTGNPYNWGTSVYMGYNWWGPSYYSYNYYPSTYWYYNSGWGWGTGWGCNNGWGYNGFYDPWNNYGWGYNNWYGWNPYPNYYGYWNGYNNGYYNGWYNGYYSGLYDNNYFNSYDNNSYYYGPRRSPSSNERDGGMAVNNGTLGERVMSDLTVANNGVAPVSREELDKTIGVHTAPPVSTISNRPTPVYSRPVNNNSTISTTPSETTTRPTYGSGSSEQGRERPVYTPPSSTSERPSNSGRNDGGSSTPRTERPKQDPTPTPRESRPHQSTSSGSSSSGSSSSGRSSGNSSSGNSSRSNSGNSSPRPR